MGSPGIETKEVFLPVNQLSFKAQLTSDLTVAGQYALEWKPLRAPNGGTYLMGADTAPNVDRLGVAPGRCIYVGDDERDIIAGRAAGMRTVAATYGYMGEQAEVARWDADIAIASPLDLLKWLELA